MSSTTDTQEETAAPEGPVGRRPRLSLSAQVFIALALGILAGLFFGELIGPVQILSLIHI